MSVGDWLMLSAVGAFVVVLAWSYRVTTPLFRDLQRKPTPKPTPKPAGPYRVAGDGTFATVNCTVELVVDPAKVVALTEAQREHAVSVCVDEAVRVVGSGKIAADIRRQFAAIATGAGQSGDAS